jgi:hypothetical protein
VRVLIPTAVLNKAREFFEESGADGREGTGMLAARPAPDGWLVTAFRAPDQHAGDSGGWVEVTASGKLDLAANLAADERWVARIHSHPADAFHSAVDDANPVITAEGSLSIVVPYFGLGLRRGLSRCAIYERRNGLWRQLAQEEIAQRIHVQR